jgi:hypothetical protein
MSLSYAIIIISIVKACFTLDYLSEESFSNDLSDDEPGKKPHDDSNETYNYAALQFNSENFEPLRIKYLYINSTNINTTYFESEVLNIYDLKTNETEFFENEWLKPTSDFFGNLINVYPNDETIYLNSSCLFQEPVELTKGINGYDIVHAYTFEYSDKVYRARTEVCKVSVTLFHRPIVGITIFNLKYMTPFDKLSPSDKKFRYITLRHEFIHFLGFSLTPFKYFVYPNGTRYDSFQKQLDFGDLVGQPFLTSPLLTKYTREYFNCSTAPGMLLEGNGAKGTKYSHFSRTLVQDELMTGSTIHNYRLLTNFTLRLLEDTGWYTVKYGNIKIEKTLWGKNKGCDFFNMTCSGFSEYCQVKDSLGCDYNYNFLSKCNKDNLSNCPYFIGFKNCSEQLNITTANEDMRNLLAEYPYNKFEDSSKCLINSFNGSPFNPRCQRASCDIINKKVDIFIDTQRNGTMTISCNKEDDNKYKSIIDYYGNNITFKCPYYSRMCFNEDNRIEYADDIQCTYLYPSFYLIALILLEFLI